ncbi:adenylosuccinate synthetase [Patiriisocius sp. Uisw_017]|jgi:hypothetical protein|uniref:adenylosuccinate synthetase n=1 Tax=Patiriisocius sp. Uisw_017 TaxID=3230968 RepID=UPI0039EA2E1C
MLFFKPFQTPSGTPNPGEGGTIDFTSPIEVFIYIIVPVFLFILYFLMRKKPPNK